MSVVTFDPARAKVDAAYRTEAMELYKQGKLEISDSDLKWLQQVLGTSTDENKYEIEESDDKKSNVVRKKEPDNGRAGSDKQIVTAGTMVSATCGAGVVASCLAGNVGMGTAVVGSIGLIVACLTVFAIGMRYLASKPNEKEHNELEDLKTVMENNNVELANALIKLQEAKGEVEILKEEVEQADEEVSDEIKAKQEELEKKQARIEELNEKAQSEEGLTEEEQAELETLNGEVQVLQDEIGGVKKEGADDVEDKKGELEEKQTDVDDSSDVFKTIEDVANYAETFDVASKDAADTEKTAQTMNAVLGFGVAATMNIPILSVGFAGRILQGMAIAGATASTIGAKEQSDFAKDIGEEITVRESIQQQAAEAAENIDEVDANVEDGVVKAEEVVEDLEGETPEETPPTDESPVVPPSTEPVGDDNGDGENGDDDKKDPPEV